MIRLFFLSFDSFVALMFLERNKTALQIVALILALRLVIPPVIRAWSWREGNVACGKRCICIDVSIMVSR